MQDGWSMWPLQGPIIELTKHTATCTHAFPHTKLLWAHTRFHAQTVLGTTFSHASLLWTQNCGGRIGNRNFTGKTERKEVQGVMVSCRFLFGKGFCLIAFFVFKKASEKTRYPCPEKHCCVACKNNKFTLIMFAAEKCHDAIFIPNETIFGIGTFLVFCVE